MQAGARETPTTFAALGLDGPTVGARTWRVYFAPSFHPSFSIEATVDGAAVSVTATVFTDELAVLNATLYAMAPPRFRVEHPAPPLPARFSEAAAAPPAAAGAFLAATRGLSLEDVADALGRGCDGIGIYCEETRGSGAPTHTAAVQCPTPAGDPVVHALAIAAWRLARATFPAGRAGETIAAVPLHKYIRDFPES